MMTVKEWELNLKEIAFKNRSANRERLANAYERLGESEDKWWMRQAIRCIQYISKTQPELAADDVWEHMKNMTNPSNPRSMGVVFKICHNAGMIEPTGQYRKTRRKQANGREIRVWRFCQ